MRSGRPSSPGSVPKPDEPSIQLLLPGAPAAVQAAADQVLAAHRQRGAELPAQQALLPPSPRSQPSPSQPSPSQPSPSQPSPSQALAPQAQHPAASHNKPLKTGTRINGRYQIEYLIGRGGMGTVYAVEHVHTGEKLALKLLHPALAENQAAVERFRTEARAPVRIGSEHVVRVVDADICEELGHVPYMVMERLNGHDLRSALKRRGALPAGEVVLYLKQVARALDKAHAKSIVHRDLKPANMYVIKREDGSPLVKVLDFGIAKLTDEAAQELTVAGQVFGTPWYMAPEQARGDLGRVGPQTDLWALGLIAFQLLTGQNYWTADGMAALVGQICYEPMPPPTQRAPHLGQQFDMWFARACSRDPAERFPNARDMIEELAQALGVLQSGGVTTGSGQQRFDSGGFGQTGPAYPQPAAAAGRAGVGHTTPFPAGGQPMLGAQAASLPPAGPGAARPTAGSFPGQDTQPPANLSQRVPAITPGAIPGTVVGAGQHALEGTNAPLYAAARPPARKRSSVTAALLGVVIAVTAGVGALGVYLALPGSGARPAPGAPEEGVAPAANTEDSSDEDVGDDRSDEERSQEEERDRRDGESAGAEATPSDSAQVALPPQLPPPPQFSPTPAAPTPATLSPPHPAGASKGSPAPTSAPVAPKVDKVEF